MFLKLFFSKQMNFQMFDVGGQRSERRKWIRFGLQQPVFIASKSKARPFYEPYVNP